MGFGSLHTKTVLNITRNHTHGLWVQFWLAVGSAVLPGQATPASFLLFTFTLASSPWLGSSAAYYKPDTDNVEKTHLG